MTLGPEGPSCSSRPKHDTSLNLNNDDIIKNSQSQYNSITSYHINSNILDTSFLWFCSQLGFGSSHHFICHLLHVMILYSNSIWFLVTTWAPSLFSNLSVEFLDLLPVDCVQWNEWMVGHRPTESEVKKTLFSLPHGKTPEPDGFTAAYFQKFWMELKPTIMACVRELF